MAIDCGVEGVLKSGCTVEEIKSAIRKLGQDGTYLDPGEAVEILRLLDSSEARHN